MIRYKEFEDMDKALQDKTSWKNGAPVWNILPFYFAKDFEVDRSDDEVTDVVVLDDILCRLQIALIRVYIIY